MPGPRHWFLLLLLFGRTSAAQDPGSGELRAVCAELRRAAGRREATWAAVGARRWQLCFRRGLRVHGRKVNERADGRTRQDLNWSAARMDGAWQGAELREPVYELAHLLACDASGLTPTVDEGLRGTLRLRLQRGDWKENLEVYTTNIQGVVKSRSIPVMDWSIGVERQRPAWQEWRVEADPVPDGVFLAGRLVGGLPGGKTAAFTCVLAPGAGVLSSRVRARRWNRAAHRVAGGELELADGRLRGELAVAYNRDLWVPRKLPAAGYLTQHYRIDLPVDGELVSGEVAAAGDLGSYACRLEATALRAVAGRYRSEGIDGRCTGTIYGGWAPLTDALPPPVAEDDPAALWRELALLLACRQRPTGLGPRRPAQRLLAGDGPTVRAALAVRATANLAALRAGHRPRVGIDRDLDPAFGPFYGRAKPLARTDDGRYVLPPVEGGADAPQRWAALPEFTAYGPLRAGGTPLTWTHAAHPILPEIMPEAAPPSLAGGPWTTRWDGKRATASTAVAALITERRLHRSVWYARAVVRCTEPRDTWCAIMVHDDGVLYRDGVQVWASGPRHGGRETAVVPLHLHAGDNELMIRVGSQQGFGRYDEGRGGPGCLALHLCLTGGPRPDVPEPVLEPEAPAVAAPEDLPVLAWDLEDGTNVAWRRDLAVRGDPLPVDGGVVVACGDGDLRCLAAADGSGRWRVAAPAGGAWHGPVTDGSGVVWAASPDGSVVSVAASDGTVRWRTRCRERPPAGAGGLHPAAEALLWLQPGARVVALDRADGGTLWVRHLPGDAGAPACLVPAAPTEALALVTAGGCAVAVADGALLATGISPGHPCPLAPAARGRRVVLRGGEVAVDLVEDRHGRLGWRLAWEVERYKHYGYPDWPGAAPGIADDGLIYVLRDAPEHSTHGPMPASHLYQIDPVTGHVSAYRKRFITDALHPSDLRCAGPLIAGVDRGGDIFAGEDRGPQIALAASGDPPLILGTNPGLPGGRAPVHDGADGWYLAGGGRLYRLAVNGERGRHLAVGRPVQELYLWDLFPRPHPKAVRAIPPLPRPVDPGRAPVHPFWYNGAPVRWLAGVPRAAAADASRPPAFAGEEPDWDALEPVSPACLNHDIAMGVVGGRSLFLPRFSIEPLRLLERREHTEIFLASVLRVDTPVVTRTRLSRYGLAVWLNGRSLENDGFVSLEPGDYAVVARVRLGRIASFMKRLRISLTFKPVTPPEEALAEWEAMARLRRSWLERLCALAPDSSGAARARFLLKAIAPADGEDP